MEETEVVRSAAYERAYKMAREFDDTRLEDLDAIRAPINWLADELEKHQPAEQDREALDHVTGFIHGIADCCGCRAYE